MSVAEVLVRDRAGRIALIVLLLGELDYEYLPSAKTLQLASKPGPAASERVACSCATLRTVIYRDARCCPEGCDKKHEHTRQVQRSELVGRPKCDVCHGEGWRRRITALDGEEGHDEYVYAQDKADAPMRRRLLGVEQKRQTMTLRDVDLALDRLAASWPSLQPKDEKPREEAYPWELARARRDKSGDFAALIRALDELRMWSEPAYRALKNDGNPFLIGEALFFLESVMPDPVRVPQQLRDSEGYRHRSSSVQELHAKGRTPRQISRELQMDLRKVKSVLQSSVQSAPPADALASATTTRHHP